MMHTKNWFLISQELAAEVEELFGMDPRIDAGDDEDTRVWARFPIVAH